MSHETVRHLTIDDLADLHQLTWRIGEALAAARTGEVRLDQAGSIQYLQATIPDGGTFVGRMDERLFIAEAVGDIDRIRRRLVDRYGLQTR